MGADAESAYDVLGINWKMAPENIKKKYMLSSVKSVYFGSTKNNQYRALEYLMDNAK